MQNVTMVLPGKNVFGVFATSYQKVIRINEGECSDEGYKQECVYMCKTIRLYIIHVDIECVCVCVFACMCVC